MCISIHLNSKNEEEKGIQFYYSILINKPLFLRKAHFLSLLNLCRNVQYWLSCFVLFLRGELNFPPADRNKNEKLFLPEKVSLQTFNYLCLNV